MGVCLALTYLWRNDLRQPGPGPVTHDGSRFERHEPGDCGDDSDYCDWLYRRRAGLQDHRTPTAAEVGIDQPRRTGQRPVLSPTFSGINTSYINTSYIIDLLVIGKEPY